MRIAFLSDIHANLQAFEAVLTDISAQKVDRTICLGDAVGYGPQPAEVLSLLHAHVHHMLMGNHEAAVAGLMDLSDFIADARRMIAWTRGRLNEAAIKYLAGLPYEFAGPDFACVHGSFVGPKDFNYVETEAEARAAFARRPEPLLFFGHTHDPVIFVLDPVGGCTRCQPDTFSIRPGRRYLVNPGSVGLPRGNDFRASYCILDAEARKVTFNRVVYSAQAFRQQVEKCSSDVEQVAYVLSLFDSLALPTLNKRMNFAAAAPKAAAPTPPSPAAKPPAKMVVRVGKSTPAAPPAPAAAPAAAAAPAPDASPPKKPLPPSEPPSSRGLVVTLAAIAVLGVAAVAGILVVNARREQATNADGPGAPASIPAARPAVPSPAPSAAPTAAPVEVKAPAPRPAPAPQVALSRPGAALSGRTWKAAWKQDETQTFQWNADGSWTSAGFPDAAGAEALLDVGRSGVRTINVQLGRDITVGAVYAIEQANASFIWMKDRVLIFDNGPARARWVRNKGADRLNALRLAIHTDLRLNSTLEAAWSVQRGIDLDGQISGPGGFILDHYAGDNVPNNRQVAFRGAPNTYAGGTTVNGHGGAARPSLVLADKNGAFGTGDLTINEFVQLTLTDRGAPDDMIADGATLRLTAANGERSRVILNAGVEETVGGLTFNGEPQAAGTWGAGASGAQHTNDEFFSGPGVLVVRLATSARR